MSGASEIVLARHAIKKPHNPFNHRKISIAASPVEALQNSVLLHHPDVQVTRRSFGDKVVIGRIDKVRTYLKWLHLEPFLSEGVHDSPRNGSFADAAGNACDNYPGNIHGSEFTCLLILSFRLIFILTIMISGSCCKSAGL